MTRRGFMVAGAGILAALSLLGLQFRRHVADELRHQHQGEAMHMTHREWKNGRTMTERYCGLCGRVHYMPERA
jgi:hypothetical protein